MSETPKVRGAADDKTPSGSSSAKSRVELVSVNLTVNGQPRTMTIEPRTTLLDALRENLALTGTKKACDRGECGACTVHIDGRRVLSCMTLAAMQEGKKITTIEGLEREGTLHPLQSAFIEHDGFQCGFCTSGQIMSGVAMIEEAKAGWPSAASADVRMPFALADLSRAEIRERMSGNLCRCACYPNIVDAVAEVVARSCDQLRPKVPKLAALMDEAEADVLAFMSFPKDQRSTRKGAVKKRSQRQNQSDGRSAGRSEAAPAANSCRKRRPARKNTKASVVSAANDAAEKSYRVVGNTGHWAISEDNAEPAGDYATREGALEAIYLAASNDIKKGRGVTIRIGPPPPDAPATGGKP
jgi:xanthine dehydrogenase YagT iron-sulfur-binding subunit